MNCGPLKSMMFLFQKSEQEKYTLQRELELKTRMLGSLNAEYDTLKQLQHIQLDRLREQLERLHGQEINELKNKVWGIPICEVCIVYD